MLCLGTSTLKVDNHYSTTSFIRILYVQVVCGLVWLKNEYKKKHMFTEIGLHAQNMITIQRSIANIIEETHMIIQWAPKSPLW